MEQTELPYQVKLEQFEGPLDLLLHLIKKNEVNIYDIPIALITQQYLEYLSAMKSLNLGVAGEFLVMAATLMHIKSRLLLPADETEDDEDEGIDPRDELVRRLLEYRRYKEAAGQLDERERQWRDVFGREISPQPPVTLHDTVLDEISLFELVDALQGILARIPGQQLIQIEPDNITVKDRMNAILELLETKESVTFQSLFDGQEHRMLIIVTFLALLELVRLRLLRLFQGEAFGSILLLRNFSPMSGDERVEV